MRSPADGMRKSALDSIIDSEDQIENLSTEVICEPFDGPFNIWVCLNVSDLEQAQSETRS